MRQKIMPLFAFVTGLAIGYCYESSPIVQKETVNSTKVKPKVRVFLFNRIEPKPQNTFCYVKGRRYGYPLGYQKEDGTLVEESKEITQNTDGSITCSHVTTEYFEGLNDVFKKKTPCVCTKKDIDELQNAIKKRQKRKEQVRKFRELKKIRPSLHPATKRQVAQKNTPTGFYPPYQRIALNT